MYQESDLMIKFKKFINIDGFRQYEIVPVHNSKTDHLFIYDHSTFILHILKS